MTMSGGREKSKAKERAAYPSTSLQIFTTIFNLLPGRLLRMTRRVKVDFSTSLQMFTTKVYLKVFFCFFASFYFTVFSVTAQDTAYSKQIIDSLSSSYFHGRGYTNSGAWLASEYISSELQKNNVSPLFAKSYFQPFTIPVTYVTGNPEIKLDEQILTPAEDYVIWPSSPTAKGNFSLFRLKPNNIQDLFLEDMTSCFIVIDTVMQKHPDLKEFTELMIYGNPFSAKGIIILTEKPMQVHRPTTAKWLHIDMLYSAFDTAAKKVYVDVSTVQEKKYEIRNAGGIIKGKSDSVIVFTAHYDHIGEFGNYFFPGANDNASGVSMLLTLAKHFGNIKPKYTVAFLFFTGEEIGLKGSEYYADNPAFPLKKIKVLFNLDMVGTGDEGITVVNGSVHKSDFDKMVELNDKNKYVPVIKARGESRGSDHHHFHKNGVKCFFIYTTGGSQAYHNIYDVPSALSLNSYKGLYNLLLKMAE